MAINYTHPICIYSDFGMGKTTLSVELAKQFLGPGEKMRIVTAEHYNSIQEDIDTGLVEVWKVNTRQHPFESLRLAVRGYWPADPLDPESPLVPPTAQTWKDYPVRSFEGMNTFSNFLAGDYAEGGLADRAAKGDSIGFDDGGKVNFQDGTVSVGGSSRTHYGIVQREIIGLVQTSQQRPGYVFWTTHADIIFQKGTGLPLYGGPEVHGGALTASIGKEFADVWRIGGVAVDLSDEAGNVQRIVERNLYIKEHSQDGIPWKAKNSAGLARQADTPSYFSMTANGLPKLDIGERIVKRLWPAKVSPVAVGERGGK